MTTFTGKKILVVGGSRGIGAAIVRRFAADRGTVAFTFAGSQDAAEALAAETGARAIRSDAADRDAVIGVAGSQSPLDVLVVNAGALVIGNPLELDADAIDRMIDINIRAPYHAAIEAVDQELHRRDPRTGVSLRERVRTQQHRGSHDLVRIRLADAAGMRA